MGKQEKIGRLSTEELARIEAYEMAHWTKRLAQAVLGKKPNDAERELAKRQNATLFSHVFEDASKMLAYAHEIDELLNLHDIAEDITLAEIDATKDLFFPHQPVVIANSLLFDDPTHVQAMYGILRASHDAPMVGMDAYRYVTVFHGEPTPYALNNELFVVGLMRHEGRAENTVIAKASLEPVFMDTLDAFGGLENFASKEDLARIVAADLAATVETHTALSQAAV